MKKRRLSVFAAIVMSMCLIGSGFVSLADDGGNPVPQGNTRIKTNFTNEEDSLTWNGEGTKQSPKQKSMTGEKNEFTAEPIDKAATINGKAGKYTKALNIGENVFDITVTTGDGTKTTYYRFIVTRQQPIEKKKAEEHKEVIASVKKVMKIQEQKEVKPEEVKQEPNVIKPAEKVPAKTPAAPVLKYKTYTTIVVEVAEGQKYSIDGGKTWQDSGEFTNLKPETAYEIVTYLPETETSGASEVSEPLKVTTAKTEKPKAEAPEKPVLEEVTDSKIKVKTMKGLEYSIDGGKTWQVSGEFANLEPAKAYEIVARVGETEESGASEPSEALKVTTEKGAGKTPEKPVLEKVTDSTVKVKAAEGMEYSIDGGKTWQTSSEFTNLQPVTAYEIVVRTAETEKAKASQPSEALKVTTEKADTKAPGKPELDKATDTTITVKAVKGQEYSIDGGKTWQDSNTFKGLTSKKEYSIISRVKETDKTKASPSSEALKVTTKEKAVANTKKTTTKAARTGDNSRVGLYIGFAVVSLLLVIAAVLLKRKNRQI